jgi:Xaa-Pro dipeptidase
MSQRPELAAQYRGHVARLGVEYGRAIAGAGLDALVIHSGTAKKINDFDDQYWPLRPTPAFAHWLPLAEAECALLIRPGQQPRLLRAIEDSYWEGKLAPESDHFWAEVDVAEVAADRIARELQNVTRIGFVGENIDRARQWGIPEAAINPSGLIAALDAVRAIKSDYERSCIAEASRRGARGHAAVLDAFRNGGCSELELHLLYLDATAQDALDTPYKNIVAIGEHAAILHHVLYERSRIGDQATSLLLDAGATFCGYASDITRTYVRGRGDGSEVFAALIAGVERLQQDLCRRIAPGMAFEELHDQAHELLAGVLRDLGVANASAGELVQSGITRAFFPHGLGHSLGIQVHDVGCKTKPPEQRNPHLRNTSDVAIGQVFTVEPGCYFIDSLLEPLRAQAGGRAVDWKLVDRLRRFGGVRIEDNVAVLHGGTQNLTRDNWPSPHYS